MKIVWILAFIIITTSVNLYSFSSLGAGTKGDPYQITNVVQLQEMIDDLNAHDILMNVIDASESKD